MSYGRVYVWTSDPALPLGGRVMPSLEPLRHLEGKEAGLSGTYVRVLNGGFQNELDPESGAVRTVPIGEAIPNAEGDFIFGRMRGGKRIDRMPIAKPRNLANYIEASHFGQVNTYYHLDKIATYVDDLLEELGRPSLPRVTAVVNAHNAVREQAGVRDGVQGTRCWLPFQGGHYRLPSRRYDIPELTPISPEGEIHLGPGWQLLERGALAEAAGHHYRANASHNAGILYHEYGHHVTRHTADLQANSLRPPLNQKNRKTALDEGTCDYLAATMLGTPHIWVWHHHHDENDNHPRSLVSPKTMADYDRAPKADPHANGTIWAATLWDLRTRISAGDPNGARKTDLLVLQSLLLIRQLPGNSDVATPREIAAARSSFQAGLAALLRADELLNAGHHRGSILAAFARRGIQPEANLHWFKTARSSTKRRELAEAGTSSGPAASPGRPILTLVNPDEIPDEESLLTTASLASYLDRLAEPALSLIAVGDIMLAGRARPIITERGPGYSFEAVRPLLRRAPLIVGNLEGPLARKARKTSRYYAYRADPRLAAALAKEGINVVSLANNHLLDCGRRGVVETLGALRAAGISPLGAGLDAKKAFVPVIRKVGPFRVGLLAYYWNGRTAAKETQPGSAMDTPERLEADIGALRTLADRIVVFFHWGVPYERTPSAEDRDKARYAIDRGAHIVIGHHPHVIQPFEIYRGCPIFYSVGNFAFGSGNSQAEGLLLGIRFEETRTSIEVYALYVKNRDPRVNYQPRVLAGMGAKRLLARLAGLSDAYGSALAIEECRGRLILPLPDDRRADKEGYHVRAQ